MNPLRAKLKDSSLDAELSKNGYVVIPRLYDQNCVNSLLAIYQESHTDQDKTTDVMWNSLYDVSIRSGLSLSDRILQIIHPGLDSILENFIAPVGLLMSKNKGLQSEIYLHRDTSTHEEDKFSYINIWIPLVDTNENTGALYFLKGSNTIFNYPRPHTLDWHYGHLTSGLTPYAETIRSRAGDCILFLDKTLHGSHPNQTDAFRPVVFLGALHPEAEMMYYFYDRDLNQVRVYSVPREFYFGKDFSEPIGKYPHKFSFTYDPDQLNLDEVVAELKKQRS